jgi:metal-responsive CopG/Arc/MetJ family transcriptional regulator
MPKQLINFAIQKDMLSQVDALSKKEDRSRSGIIRDAIFLYLLSTKDRARQFARIKMIANTVGMDQKKADKLIDEIRATLPENI